ncbi:T9SS type A sorting domain-containing protein [uncultured Fibrella sp.]|uniref:T9SS type A sorting domain-containing protein n=1 Tax=uncultured Fibrella sp. TaxID=1284596 RepID=UPI0035C99D6B
MKTLYILALVLVCTVNVSVHAQLSLSWPPDHSVFQRDGNDQASIIVAGQYLGIDPCNSSISEIRYKINRLNKYGNVESVYQNWTSLAGGGFYGKFQLGSSLTAGWYLIEVQVFENGILAQSGSLKTGVGDVYIIAGQSNAQSITTSNIPSNPPYDCVVTNPYQAACDYVSGSTPFPRYPYFSPLGINQPIAPTGYNNWCYTVLGNLLVDNNNVPVSFFNAAYGSTDIKSWWDSSNGIPVTSVPYIGHPCSPLGVPNNSGLPYVKLKQCLNFYASIFGVKSVLWHQGESDNLTGTNQSTYYNQLTSIINKSRSDFNNNSSLSWMVSAPATYNVGLTSTAIAAAQFQATSFLNCNLGPNTDQFGSTFRPNDNVHFEGTGLTALGNEWKTKLPSGNNIAPNPFPQGLYLLNNNDGSYTVFAPSGYTEYVWSPGNLSDGNSTGGNESYTSYAGQSIRCYMRNGNNWVVSETVYLPACSDGGFRKSAKSEENIIPLKFTIYPNPAEEVVTVEFTLSERSQTQLDLLDNSGRVVKTIAEGEYSMEKFSHSENIKSLPDGVYFLRLKANNIFMSKKFLKRSK